MIRQNIDLTTPEGKAEWQAIQRGGSPPVAAPVETVKRKKPLKMSSAEREYELILKARFPGCVIRFEAYTLKLADDCRYTPDFCVSHNDGRLSFFEVKGKFLFRNATASSTASSLTKPKLAAALFPHEFYIAQKLDGGWQLTRLNGQAL